MDSPVFKSFAFYGAIMCGKMMAMSFLTARQRFAKGVFANPEDAATDSKNKVSFVDQDVERVRRCHQNDIENIVPFFFLGALFCTTNPNPGLALNLFRVFAGARCLHTVTYLCKIPQPSRALSFFVNMGINIYMAYSVITYYM